MNTHKFISLPKLQEVFYKTKPNTVKGNLLRYKQDNPDKFIDTRTVPPGTQNVSPPKNTPHSQTPQSRQGDKPGTPLKLTEEVLETALVKALRDDPIKALNPALAFLDKKKSLSVADDETEQTEDQKKYYNEVLSNVYR